MELTPRNTAEHLEELTAAVETLRLAIWSMAPQLPERARFLAEFDQGAAALLALTNGQLHSDRYLRFLEEHIRKTRFGMAA